MGSNQRLTKCLGNGINLWQGKPRARCRQKAFKKELRHGLGFSIGRAMTDLRQASKSGKGPRQEVMKNLSDESFCFCLSSATWACIGWPVIVVDCGADACFVPDAEGQADFMFIEQPEMWMVVEKPVCIEWQGGLRVARQSSGVERSLLRTFQHSQRCLDLNEVAL